GGQAYITTDSAVMKRGKEVFAESCAACHSSKQPPANINPRSGEGKAWLRAAVTAPDFLENNFLSNEKRYPLTQIETNSARAFGTNAKAGHVWDNFSSQTYKELSPVDELEFFNPFNETQPIKFVPKALGKLADKDGYIKIGPIPKGMPVNLLGNLEPDFGQLVVLQAKIGNALLKIHAMNLSSEQATAELTKAVPELLAANKCPD